MKKKIELWILRVCLVISVFLNLYYYGYKALERKETRDLNRGVNIAVNQIVKEITEKKQVTIKTGNGPLVLVRKGE
jgi:hypothetical protein